MYIKLDHCIHKFVFISEGNKVHTEISTNTVVVCKYTSLLTRERETTDITYLYNICFINNYILVSCSIEGPSWSILYGSWICNYLCNQCPSPLTFWVRIPLRRGVLDTTLCDKNCQWLAAGRWFSSGALVSSTNKTYHHDITEILLKVALNIIALTLILFHW